MQYTTSDAFITHVASGHRMHQGTAPVTTKVTSDDMNMVIWSLMELLNAGSVSPVAFNPDTPASYQALLTAVRNVAQAQVQPALVPTGTVIHGYFTAAPTGYLFGDGQLVSRTTYATLWAHAQASSLTVTESAWSAGANGLFGVGDGSTTFRLPDLRAEHLRALDRSRGVDTGRTLGSKQLDALQNITGTFAMSSGGPIGATGAFASDSATRMTHISASLVGDDPGFTFDASRVARTAAETRGRNVALAACIKY